MTTTKLGYDKNLDEAAQLEMATSMLDSNLSDIDDLPDFVKLLPGSYLLSDFQKCEISQDEKSVSIDVIAVIDTTIELRAFPNVAPADLDETTQAMLPKPGSLVSQRFMGALGIQKFKKAVTPLLEANGIPQETSVRTVVEMISSGQFPGCAIMTTTRKDKEKKDIHPVTGELVPVEYTEVIQFVSV